MSIASKRREPGKANSAPPLSPDSKALADAFRLNYRRLLLLCLQAVGHSLAVRIALRNSQDLWIGVSCDLLITTL